MLTAGATGSQTSGCTTPHDRPRLTGRSEAGGQAGRDRRRVVSGGVSCGCDRRPPSEKPQPTVDRSTENVWPAHMPAAGTQAGVVRSRLSIHAPPGPHARPAAVASGRDPRRPCSDRGFVRPRRRPNPQHRGPCERLSEWSSSGPRQAVRRHLHLQRADLRHRPPPSRVRRLFHLDGAGQGEAAGRRALHGRIPARCRAGAGQEADCRQSRRYLRQWRRGVIDLGARHDDVDDAHRCLRCRTARSDAPCRRGPPRHGHRGADVRPGPAAGDRRSGRPVRGRGRLRRGGRRTRRHHRIPH
jgi:hypothetical protein